jgi:hypothetical protein
MEIGMDRWMDGVKRWLLTMFCMVDIVCMVGVVAMWLVMYILDVGCSSLCMLYIFLQLTM